MEIPLEGPVQLARTGAIPGLSPKKFAKPGGLADDGTNWFSPDNVPNESATQGGVF